MAKPTGSGALRERLHFQSRAMVDDGYGNEQAGDFATVFTTAARLTPIKGSEPVIASRLAGVQPYIISIRSCVAARAVTTAWRAVDARNPSRIFNITSAANVDEKNAYIDMMATQGVAS
ncbi:head-tail adaptor protein [Rhizobium sp. 16-449-1b]|uniref:head-tail adaptor protein n=1 Tax=Rhizobium sp. 16-449-1b TaxID=2819989 RepID=UPI001ADB4BAD|nr:head-tail adaptor protein [Rhizobium sp. 16-449-1b]MBO9194331.1 head-tail adaptor protein [Rhizobium sp. 16-449-1b]